MEANMINNELNKIYFLLNKKDVYNRKKYFKYGWSINHQDILKFFYSQKSLSSSERYIKNGDYIVLVHDRDSGEFGYARWGNDPGYIQRVYKMR